MPGWNRLGSLRKTECGRPGLEGSQGARMPELASPLGCAGGSLRIAGCRDVASLEGASLGSSRAGSASEVSVSAVVPGMQQRCCQVGKSSSKKEGERKATVGRGGWERLAVPSIPGASRAPGGLRAGLSGTWGVHSSILVLGQAGGCRGGWSGAPRRLGVPSPGTEGREGRAGAVGGRRL